LGEIFGPFSPIVNQLYMFIKLLISTNATAIPCLVTKWFCLFYLSLSNVHGQPIFFTYTNPRTTIPNATILRRIHSGYGPFFVFSVVGMVVLGTVFIHSRYGLFWEWSVLGMVALGMVVPGLVVLGLAPIFSLLSSSPVSTKY
jgi:hypothetical protein